MLAMGALPKRSSQNSHPRTYKLIKIQSQKFPDLLKLEKNPMINTKFQMGLFTDYNARMKKELSNKL